MQAPSPYRAEIEQVENSRRPEMPLFRYFIRHEERGVIVFDGVASDMREAIDSVNAWLASLGDAAAA